MKLLKRVNKPVVSVIGIMIALFAVASVTATPRSASPYAKLSIFAKVLSHLERYYVEPLDEEEVVVGAIKGMMRTVDPHSAFLTPEEFKILEGDTKGQFGGIGVEVGIRDGVLTVIAPMSGSPAEEAGIEPGDQIVAVEGELTGKMSLEEMVQKMRGEPGTSVTMTLLREGSLEPFDVTLVREIIEVESVNAELLAPGFPWIRVRSFQDGTTAEVIDAIDKLTREGGGLEGIVLDLRRNPGGVLNEAVRMADLFISDGTLLTTRGRDGAIINDFKAGKRGTMSELPVVCMIDGASASASEIVAGALQDHGRALLVGMKSYGKGSVQSIIDLGDGYGLKLTIARYFTPSGKSIQAEGVRPDVTIESLNAPEPDEETAALTAIPGESELPGALAPQGSNQGEELVEIEDYQLRIAFQLLVGLAHQSKKGD